jgi:hypothetical protein
MKKLSVIAILFATIMAMGCGGKKDKAKIEYISTPTIEAVDSTLYGSCGEGTLMNSLELLTDSGDTVVCSIEEASAKGEVKGGLMAGDRMAVVATVDANGERAALSVVNINTLLGRWANLDRSFELMSDGTVVSNVKEPHPYTSWRMLNGKLLLSADTFEIRTLGPDSLLLYGGNGLTGYRRLAANAQNIANVSARQ